MSRFPARQDLNTIKLILIENYIEKHLHCNPKYEDAKRLNRYENKVYSQNGEDGIINEIIERIGVTNRYFVEVGVGNGLENNTVYLLMKGWRGCWIDGSSERVDYIGEKFQFALHSDQLSVRHAFVNAENIENLLQELEVPDEFDVLSIDIDGNDYWEWQAIRAYRPRVVVIEYNAIFPPPDRLVMKYRADSIYDRTSYYGASLKSLELLGAEKDYCLVTCNFAGVNAFFVRKDLVENKFCEPFTAENHFERPRYYLHRWIGHRPNVGEYLEL